MTHIGEADVRSEVNHWLDANWDPSLSLVEWRNRLAESGWGAPHWPSEWFGKGLPPVMQGVVEGEFEKRDVPGMSRKGASKLASLTILAHGSDEHKRRFLKRLMTGEDTWCQLFSEPGSGSDLAAAMTRAELRDGRWIVNGQKVWTTSAHLADWGILLARTNLDVPKHQGLSYFLIDMRQPGVEVRPLRQMNGHASFNEVFFADAVVAAEDMLESEGDGWRIATTTLMHERRGADSSRRAMQARNLPGRIYAEEAEEIATAMEPYIWYPQRGGRCDLIIPRAVESGKIRDPLIRDQIAKLMTLKLTAEWARQRARSALEQGRTPGPDGSIGKLATSMVSRAAAHVHTLLSGTNAMLTGSDGERDGLIAEILVSTPAQSIAGGTDEIQKNILAERVLKMPKEKREDNDRPFRDVPKNTLASRR